MGADIEFVAAISRMLDGGPGVVLQPAIYPRTELQMGQHFAGEQER